MVNMILTIDDCELIANKMINQFEEYGEEGPAENGLRVDLDLRSKEQPLQVQWMDEPRKKRGARKKGSPKPQASPPKPKNPVLSALDDQLQSSKRLMKKGVPDTVKQQLDGLENKVYATETNDNKKQYLHSIYQKSGQNRYIKDEIYETISGAQSMVQKDIKNRGAPAFNRKIPKNKNELKDMERADAYRMIKIKQGVVKDKVGSLKKDLDQIYIKSRIKDRARQMEAAVDHRYFSIDHPRTKQAQNFVQQVQYRRREERRQYEMDMSARRQKLDYMKEKQMQMKQMQRQERRTKLRQYYDSKFQKRLEEKQIEKRKKQEFKEWIQQYQRQRPLQAEKQEQYRMKVLIPQLQQRHKKLMTIKAQRRPIDSDQIAEHEMKYLEFKKDDEIRKRAEIQLLEQDDEIRKQQLDQRMYKGKYRMMVLQQMLEEKYPMSSKQVQKSKKDRIKAYDSIIRTSARTHNQRAPGETLEGQSVNKQKFVRRVRNINGSLTVHNKPGTTQSVALPQLNSDRPNRKASQELDPYKQGIKNLAYMKSFVRQKVEKQQQNKPIINLVEQRQIIKPKGFLQLQRQKRLNKKKQDTIFIKQMQSTDITNTQVKGNDDIGLIKAKAQQIDDKIKREQARIRNNKDDNFGVKAQAEQDYVTAIKKKIQILDQFK